MSLAACSRSLFWENSPAEASTNSNDRKPLEEAASFATALFVMASSSLSMGHLFQ
jgi:hypothetical protein